MASLDFKDEDAVIAEIHQVAQRLYNEDGRAGNLYEQSISVVIHFEYEALTEIELQHLRQDSQNG